MNGLTFVFALARRGLAARCVGSGTTEEEVVDALHILFHAVVGRAFLPFAACRSAGVVFVVVGYLAIDALAEEVRSGEALDHTACIAIGHIKERISGHEVDTTYINPLSCHQMVEHVNKVAGIEPVDFTCIDIYTRHPLFGCAAVFFLGVGHALTLLALLAGLFVDKVDFWCVAVIVEQTVALQ